MKSITFACAFGCFLIAVSPSNAAAIINTVQDLQNMALAPLGPYVLGQDIDASGFAFTGLLAAPLSFDGQGHVIKNLTVTSFPSCAFPGYGGLFCFNSGTIKNLTLENLTVNAGAQQPIVGGLVGWNLGTIDNVKVSGRVNNIHAFEIGGLAGNNEGTITRSSSSASVIAGHGTDGGLVGTNAGRISQSFATGWVQDANPDNLGGGALGGLVGANQNTIEESYATGAVSANWIGIAGGLIGENANFYGGQVQQTYATGRVTGGYYAGGLVGLNLNSGAPTVVNSSYWDIQSTGIASSPVGTGLVSASLRGVLPSGFNSGVWKTMPGQYPLLAWQSGAASAPPTLLELASLSDGSHVYSSNLGVNQFAYAFDNADVGDNIDFNGRKYAGFRAAAYATSDKAQVVVAFRGTDLATLTTVIKNAVADSSFVKNTPTQDMITSMFLAVKFLDDVRRRYPNAKITLTGWSLGGAIAQLLGKATGYEVDAFNAPGAGQLYNTLFPTGSYVQCSIQCGPNTNYRMDNDLISLAGSPIGFVKSISGLPQWSYLGNAGNPPGFILRNFRQILANHDVGNIALLLQQGEAFRNNIIDPTLFQDVAALEGIVYPTDLPTAIIDVTDPTRLIIASLFHISVTLAGGGFSLFDPESAWQYTFVGQPGSPQISCLDLPTMDGVMGYDFSYLTGGVWSTSASVAPGEQECFSVPADGIEFKAYDFNGQDVLLTDSFVFGLSFATTGEFDGQLLALAPRPSVPEPGGIWIVFVGLMFTALSVRKAAPHLRR